ncbi:MAG: ABC-F family ATP-binding cassette domain-containing protein [Acidimicrobiia bacterium]
MILVDLRGVSARRPERALFEELSLTLETGDRLGVVGRNGAGKSTLLGLLAGELNADEGTVRRGRGVRVGYLPQRPELRPGTVAEAVGPGWEAAAILERLGMGSLSDTSVDELSGGQAKRVALARVLVAEVDLLILDEPTNHLDIDAIAWLEDRLDAFRGGMAIVTHDRHVLDRLTNRVLELDRGRGHQSGDGYEGYLAARAERIEREASTEAVRRNLARRELAWLRRGAPARTRKSKARIASATAIVEGAGAGPGVDRVGSLDWAAASRTGPARLPDKVLVLSGVGHRFGDEPWLFRDLDLDLEPGGRLGVVGPNGSGKSTLLDILSGRLEPSTGKIEVGRRIRIGYNDQRGGPLDSHERVREAVAGSLGQPTWEQVRLMERFWFEADAQWAPIGTLSGGERRRLQLLLVLAEMPNVLLLDEPTNDLDLDTLRALEDFLDGWPGSLVVVSHDRALLGRTVEDVLALGGDGPVAVSSGGYTSEIPRSRPAQRVLGAAPTARTQPSPARPARLSSERLRSPSTLRRLIELAEREMNAAAARRDRLIADLAIPHRDHLAIAAVARSLGEAEEQLTAAEERWLALSEELGA